MAKNKYLGKKTCLVMVILAVLAVSIFSSGCSSESKDNTIVEKQQEIYAAAQPVPVFQSSLERDTVIQIYKARNTQVATHAVEYSDYGTILDDFPSIGFPIPGDVQLTNPLQTAYSSSGAVIEQAEPNGLYSSKTTCATWVREVVEIDGVAKQVPVYIENKVVCYPYPIEVNYTTNRVTRLKDQKPTVFIVPNTTAATA